MVWVRYGTRNHLSHMRFPQNAKMAVTDTQKAQSHCLPDRLLVFADVRLAKSFA